MNPTFVSFYNSLVQFHNQFNPITASNKSAWKKPALQKIQQEVRGLDPEIVRDIRNENVDCDQFPNPEACQMVKTMLLIVDYRNNPS